MRLSLLAMGFLLASPWIVAAPQGGGGSTVLGGSGLGNCDIDLRPKSRMESQVYWSSPEQVTETLFEVYVPEGVGVEAGDGDGGQALQLTRGKNIVRFIHAAGRLDMQIVPAGISTQPVPSPVRYRGEFDPIAFPLDPKMEEVRNPGGRPNYLRQRITMTNYGQTFSFTLTGV